MKGKFITTSLQLAVLAGKKRPVVNIKNTEEVKETKALVQAHELLWSKYNQASKQSVITNHYR